MELTLEWYAVVGVTNVLKYDHEEFPLCDHFGDVWRMSPGELFAIRAGAQIAEEIQDASDYDVKLKGDTDDIETFDALQAKLDKEFSRLNIPRVDIKQRWMQLVGELNESVAGHENRA